MRAALHRHFGSHVTCHAPRMNNRLKWDEDGSMADMWMSLCTLRLRGITETACQESVVAQLLRHEYGCSPLHVTLATGAPAREFLWPLTWLGGSVTWVSPQITRQVGWKATRLFRSKTSHPSRSSWASSRCFTRRQSQR